MTVPITIDTADAVLHGDLSASENAAGLVVFAHGSGSSRHSPRNRAVANSLRDNGLATLLVDLVAGDIVGRRREPAFDLELHAARLSSVFDELARMDGLSNLPVGLFGASTGGSSALAAAAARPDRVRAVVCRGGRPDLAGAIVESVRVPVLFLVGEHDPDVLEVNRSAAARMPLKPELRIVPDAGHLFTEPGALEAVAALATEWLTTQLT